MSIHIRDGIECEWCMQAVCVCVLAPLRVSSLGGVCMSIHIRDGIECEWCMQAACLCVCSCIKPALSMYEYMYIHDCVV